MNNTLKAIKEQTNDLPDLHASASATDSAISLAFSNLTGIENLGKAPDQVVSKIRSEADQTDAKATGRTAPYPGIGTAIGYLAGRVESYSPAEDQQSVLKFNQQFYGQLFKARDTHDLDGARVVNNNIQVIQNQVTPVTNRSAEILSAHRKY